MEAMQKKWVIGLVVLSLIMGFNWISERANSRWNHSDEAAVMSETDEKTAATSENIVMSEITDQSVVVHICGAVAAPGVYTLPDGSRVNDVLVLAGGFLEKADNTCVNLAELIIDGQQIVIYEKGDAAEATYDKPGEGAVVKQGLVSINSGTMEALMTLDGIGEKTAQKILDYRRESGGFKRLEELKNVPGIGDKKYEAIKKNIRL